MFEITFSLEQASIPPSGFFRALLKCSIINKLWDQKGALSGPFYSLVSSVPSLFCPDGHLLTW